MAKCARPRAHQWTSLWFPWAWYTNPTCNYMPHWMCPRFFKQNGEGADEHCPLSRCHLSWGRGYTNMSSKNPVTLRKLLVNLALEHGGNIRSGFCNILQQQHVGIYAVARQRILPTWHRAYVFFVFPDNAAQLFPQYDSTLTTQIETSNSRTYSIFYVKECMKYKSNPTSSSKYMGQKCGNKVDINIEKGARVKLTKLLTDLFPIFLQACFCIGK